MGMLRRAKALSEPGTLAGAPVGRSLPAAGALRSWTARIPESGWVLLLPSVFLLVAFFVYPLGRVLAKSFMEPKVGFENFVSLWHSVAFRNIIIYTFEIAVWTTVICFVLGYPVAYWLATTSERWARRVMILVVAPFFTAILARLFAWTVILGDQGLINTYLVKWHVVSQPVTLIYNRTGVLIGMAQYMLPYMILALYAIMARIDPALLDAARLSGANSLQAFRRVFLPLSRPGIYAGTLLVFIISLGFFITPAVLGGGSDVTISMFVQQQIAVLQWGAATAMCVVLLVATLALFVLFNRFYGQENVTVTGGTRR